MNQMTSLCTTIGKRLIFVNLCKIQTASYTVQTETPVTSKPDGWDAAKPYKSIPGPKPLPLLGNNWRFLPFVGSLRGLDFFGLNKLFHKNYGKIARLGDVTLPDMVMIYAVEDIEHFYRNEGLYPIRDVVGKTFAYYRKNIRNDVFKGYSGVAEVHGKEWHNIRSKMNPIVMHPQTVMQYVGSMDIIASQLVQKMRYIANSDPQREMPKDFINCIYAWTLESIMAVCLDKQLGCLDINLPKDSEPLKIIEAVTEVFPLFMKLERMVTFKNIYKTKAWARYVELMDFITFTFLKHVEDSISKINEKEKQHMDESTILEQLLKVDKNLVVTTAIDFLTGGVDTTGRVAAAGLYYLAKTPNAQNTLRDEMCKLLPAKNSPITKEVLSNAPYLRAVIKETTRMAPIGATNIRQTIKDMILCGYQIPKGTRVLTSNLLLSLSDDNYVKAKEFIPERWLRSTTGELSARSANPFVTLPFGFGPRSCVGKRLANLELEIGIARIIRNFYLEWHYKDATFKTNPLYGIVDPLKLRVFEVDK